MRRSLHCPCSWLVFALLVACGGGDGGGTVTPPDNPNPPARGQTVTVHVATSGVDLDADGYLVWLGARSARVAANATATFDDVAAGSYEVRLEGVAGNCLAEGTTTRSAVVGSTSGAQLAFDIECFTEFGDGAVTVACIDMPRVALSGAPLDRIDLGPVPAGFQLPMAARVLHGDETISRTAAIVEDGGRVKLVVPLSASGNGSGGEALVRPTDGSRACPPFTVRIDSLPAAAGELSGIVDLMQQRVGIQAGIIGTSVDELRLTPIGDLARPLLPLGAVQYVLDHPQNERSLRRIAEGTAESGLDVPVDLLGGILARTGLRTALQQAAVRTTAARMSGPSPALGTQTCLPGTIGTSETAILSDCMNAQAGAQESLESPSGEALQAINDFMWLAESRSTARAQRVVPWLSAILWALENSDARAAALLPCCIVDLSLDPTPMQMEEDYPLEGTWFAYLTAQNQGWDVGREIIEAAIKSAGVGASFESLNVAGPASDDLMEAIFTGPLADFLLQDGTFDDFVVPVETFGPVPIRDRQWSDAAFAGASVRETQHGAYEPAATGRTTLRVRPRDDGARIFGGRTAVGEAALNVSEIEIEVAPADTFVAPDDVKTFRARVRNAFFPDSIRAIVDQGDAVVSDGSDGMYNVLYVAPSNGRFSNPAELEVRHIGATGARANGPPRYGRATIRFGEIVITPNVGCLDTLQEVQLAAEVRGPENTKVRWSADFGTIDTTGNYRAPSNRPAGGFATIKATSVEAPSLEAEIKVPIGCTCNFTFRLGNETFRAESGDRMVFTTPAPDNRLVFTTLTRSSRSWSLRMLPPTSDDVTDRPNAPGTWPMRVQGDFGLDGVQDILFSTDDDFPALLNLRTLVPRQEVSGTVTGTANFVSFAQRSPATFEWSFSIRYEPGEFTCTVP